MTFLVIGGLLALGVVALAVAFFLISAGDARPEGATAPQTSTRPVQSGRGTTQAATIPATAPIGPATQPIRTPSPLNSTHSGVLSRQETEELPERANPQFHEMVVELQRLRQQIGDVERRLSMLSQMAHQIEQSGETHNRLFDIEDNPTTRM